MGAIIFSMFIIQVIAIEIILFRSNITILQIYRSQLKYLRRKSHYLLFLLMSISLIVAMHISSKEYVHVTISIFVQIGLCFQWHSLIILYSEADKGKDRPPKDDR